MSAVNNAAMTAAIRAFLLVRNRHRETLKIAINAALKDAFVLHSEYMGKNEEGNPKILCNDDDRVEYLPHEDVREDYVFENNGPVA